MPTLLRNRSSALVHPGPGAQINWGHPLAAGLMAVFLPAPGGAMIDLVQQRLSGGTVGTFEAGLVGTAARDWDFTSAQTTDLNWTSGGFAVAAYFRVENLTGATFPTILGRSAYTSEAVNQGWQLDLNGTTSYRFNSFNNNDVTNYACVSTTAPVAGNHLVMGTSDGSGRSIFLDGRREGTKAQNPTPASATAVCGNVTNTTRLPLYVAYVWRRPMEQAGLWLWEEPYTLLTRPSPVKYFMLGQAPAAPPPPTGIKTKVGTFTTSTSTGLQNITSIGFQPDALILWSSGSAIALDTKANSFRSFVGVASAPGTEYCVSAASQNAASNTSHKVSSTLIGIVQWAEAVGGTASLNAWLSNGFQLNWTAAPAAPYEVHYLALKGVNAKALQWSMPTSTGNVAVTGAGFAPSCVIHIASHLGTAGQTTLGTAYAHAGLSFGLQCADTDASLGVSDTDGAGTVQRHYNATGDSTLLMAGTATNGSKTYRLNRVSLDSDGFTLNVISDANTATPTVGIPVISLCLGGVRAQVGSFTKPTGSAPQTSTLSGLPFQPKAVLFCSAYYAQAGGGSQQDWPMSIGAVDESLTQASMGLYANNNVSAASSGAEGWASTTYAIIRAATTEQAAGTVNAMNSDGFAVVFNPNEATAELINFVAFGDLGSTPNTGLNNGLISHWKLDEASGQPMYDAHSTNNLLDHGTTASGAGKLGTSRDFEAGSTNYGSIADNAALSVTSDLTIAAWVQIESKVAGARVIVGKGAAGSSNLSYQLRYSGSSGDRLNFAVSNNGSSITGGTTGQNANADNLGSPSLATWYFVIGWFDDVSNTINIQVNDGTVNTQTFSSAILDSAAEFEIGGALGASTWDGLIDSVSMWNRVLTAAERTALYNAGAGLNYPFPAVAQPRVPFSARNTLVRM